MTREYEVIKVCGRDHVIAAVPSRAQPHIEDANYLGTGKALCGVLKEGETLEQWKRRMQNMKMQRESIY